VFQDVTLPSLVIQRWLYNTYLSQASEVLCSAWRLETSLVSERTEYADLQRGGGMQCIGKPSKEKWLCRSVNGWTIVAPIGKGPRGVHAVENMG